jgi:thiamine-phosphate pyrophosphorylase
MPLPRLHLVTDDAVLADPGFADAAEAVLSRVGAQCALHLRGHGTAAARLYALGERLAAVALAHGAWLMVNDRIDIAMAIRANGVQLGAASLPVRDARALIGAHAPIGCSVHSTAGAMRATADGADFVIMGTIYASATHEGRAPAGVDALRDCAARAGVPVLAIGGITPRQVPELFAAGAHGAAVLGGVWRAADPEAAAVAYRDALAAAAPGVDDARQEMEG